VPELVLETSMTVSGEKIASRKKADTAVERDATRIHLSFYNWHGRMRKYTQTH